MNYKTAYYRLLVSFVDLAEEIEHDENKYSKKINEIIRQSDQTVWDCEQSQKHKEFIDMLFERCKDQSPFVIDEPNQSENEIKG